MILLNFPRGSGGFFLLQVARLHWPETFKYNQIRRAFIPGHEAISESDVTHIVSMQTEPNMLLCNNKDVLPNEIINSIRQNGKIFCVICSDPEDIIRSSFLYWCQAPDRSFEYVYAHNTDIDLYQAMYQQIFIHVSATHPLPEGHIIDFANLSDYESVKPLLTAIKDEFDLGTEITGAQEVYNAELSDMLAPLTQHSSLYEDFRAAYIEMRDNHIVGQNYLPDYRTLFSEDTQIRFRRVIDFFQSLYHNYTLERNK